MLEYLQHQYALSRKGTKDMVKAVLACTLSYLVLMLPVSLLYFLVSDLLNGGVPNKKLYSTSLEALFVLY